MDKHDEMQQHSIEKLRVYREYLLRYLLVLTKVPAYKVINIIDLFAGIGVSENKKRGSAPIAAGVISGFRKKTHGKKTIRFFANEKYRVRHAKLKKSLEQYDFAEITNKTADDFVGEAFAHGCLSQRQAKVSRTLLYIDPYGYTQLSQTNLAKILIEKQIEVLMFIPTFSIYRFKNKQRAGRLNSARQFLADLGMSEPTINDIKIFDDLVAKLVQALREKARTRFVYSYELPHKKSNRYHLFFVTKNVAGARKFLEAKNEIRKGQLTLFDGTGREVEVVREVLSREITNKKLYVEMIERGYLPRAVNPVLRSLEKKDILKVRPHPERQKGGYYLDNNPKTPTIHMRIDP